MRYYKHVRVHSYKQASIYNHQSLCFFLQKMKDNFKHIQNVRMWISQMIVFAILITVCWPLPACDFNLRLMTNIANDFGPHRVPQYGHKLTGKWKRWYENHKAFRGWTVYWSWFYGFYLSKQTQCGYIVRQATSTFLWHSFDADALSSTLLLRPEMRSISWLLVNVVFNHLNTDRFLYIWTVAELFKIIWASAWDFQQCGILTMCGLGRASAGFF